MLASRSPRVDLSDVGSVWEYVSDHGPALSGYGYVCGLSDVLSIENFLHGQAMLVTPSLRYDTDGSGEIDFDEFRTSSRY